MQLGASLEEDERTTQRMIDINVYGVTTARTIALERFVTRGRGHLVNIASMAGKAGYAYGATYCGTKHYVVGMSEALRGELRDTDIEVSVVMPGRRQHRARRRPHAGPRRQGRRARGRRRGDRRGAQGAALRRLRAALGRPLSQFSSALPRRAREGMARAMKADRVLRRRLRGAQELRAARLALRAGLEPAPRRRRSRRAESGVSAPEDLSQAAIRRRSSSPWSSWRKCEAFSTTSGSGAPIAAAKRCPVSSVRIGSRSRPQHQRGRSAAAAPPAWPARRRALGVRGRGSISGKARAPALLSGTGNGAA